MARALIAVFLGFVLLVAAGVVYVKMAGNDQSQTAAPKVTQRASEPPAAKPLDPNETQVMNLKFELQDGGAPFTVGIDRLEYANLADTAQVTTVTATGAISDNVHATKFWQAPTRFRLVGKTGQAFPAKPVVKGARGSLTWAVTFDKVPVQALRDKQVNLIIELPPVVVERELVPSEPIVIGVTPDRFRSM
jgi:hypothetical protein